jgi:hypothetical protein
MNMHKMNPIIHKQQTSGRFDLQTIGILLAMFAFAVIFWDTLLIYPVKLFVVILHEFSHGLAAILTGGKIIKIEISQQVGGICWTSGGLRFLVVSAGYLGSIFLGGLILIIAARTKHDSVLGVIIGGFLILLALLYIRNLFGFIFTISFGAALVIIALKASNKVIDIVMKFLGMTSCLYVIIDIKSDVIDRSNIGSDADKLAEMLGLPWLSMIIGLTWILIALIALAYFLWISGKTQART